MRSSVRSRIVLVVVLVLWGLITHSTYAGSGDEPHYLVIAHSLAFDRDLDVANNDGADEPLISGGSLPPDAHAQPGRGGVLRPVHDVGLPLLAAPYVFVARPFAERLSAAYPGVLRTFRLEPGTLYRHFISAFMIVLAALLAWQMCALNHQCVPAYARANDYASLALALSPPLLFFGVLFFSELPAALLTTVLIRALLKDGHRIVVWALIGIGVGALLLLHVRNIGMVLPLATAGFVLARRTSRDAAVAFVAGVALAVAARAALTFTFWGSFVTTPHAKPGTMPEGVLGEIATRLGGLLLDQEYGLLPYAPILLLVPVGASVIYHQAPRMFWLTVMCSAGYVTCIVLPMVNAHGWTGGWSPPARFLATIVPLAAPFLAAGFVRAARPVSIGLVVCQIAVSAYLWQHPKNAWNDGDGVAAVCARGGLPLCAWLPSFVQPGDKVDDPGAISTSAAM